jgi:hypothetical protein
MEDAARLFGHAFALPEWYFIARGQFPNVTPYIASNEGFARKARISLPAWNS